ncbi:hypothetical protein BGZ49_002336 [Haplosporangium sp. Z 27]|nr:hypothetical protein BGZ49_002336 [Haplosporangium sp. Z 27]
MPCAPTLQYTPYPPNLSPSSQPTPTMQGNDNNNFGFQQPVHPFQMDQMTSSINNLETATEARAKLEYQNNNHHHITYSSPTSPVDNPHHGQQQQQQQSLKTDLSPFRLNRGYSFSLHDSGHQHFDIPDEYPVHAFSRHGSLSSVYPMTQSHELLESIHAGPISYQMGGTPMMATNSSTSIISMASVTSNASNSSDCSTSSSPPPPSKSPTRAFRALETTC